LNNFRNRYPVLFSLLLIFIFLVGALISYLLFVRKMGLSMPVNLAISNGVFLVLLLIYISRWFGWKNVGMRKLKLKDYTHFAILLLPVFTNLVSGIKPLNWGSAISVLSLMLLVGAVEELLFRGIILNVLITKGRIMGAVVSSVFFGILHFSSALAGLTIIDTVIQVFSGLTIGLGFAGFALRTKTVWPLVLCHGLRIFTDSITEVDSCLLDGLNSLLYFLYGVFMIFSNFKLKPVNSVSDLRET